MYVCFLDTLTFLIDRGFVDSTQDDGKSKALKKVWK